MFSHILCNLIVLCSSLLNFRFVYTGSEHTHVRITLNYFIWLSFRERCVKPTYIRKVFTLRKERHHNYTDTCVYVEKPKSHREDSYVFSPAALVQIWIFIYVCLACLLLSHSHGCTEYLSPTWLFFFVCVCCTYQLAKINGFEMWNAFMVFTCMRRMPHNKTFALSNVWMSESACLRNKPSLILIAYKIHHTHVYIYALLIFIIRYCRLLILKTIWIHVYALRCRAAYCLLQF